MHNAEQWLSILGLGPDATEKQIAEAYRELVKVWHPDRFESDPSLRKKAEAKLRDINIAYEQLRGYRPPPRGSSPRQASPEEHHAAAPAAQAPDRPTSNVWIFAGVSTATAVVVGALLYFGLPRPVATTVGEAEVRPAPPSPRPRPDAAPRPRVEEVAAPEAPTTGMVSVFSQPAAATVFLDDQRVGETPLNLTELTPGEHRIRLELDGYPTWSSPVIVEAGGAEKLLAILQRKIRHATSC
jgi:hypothetical protein